MGKIEMNNNKDIDSKFGGVDFKFNREVATVFDDMLDRSVPFYHEIIKMIGDMIEKYGVRGDIIYDLGCSTGTTLIDISHRLFDKGFSFVGIDESESMIEKARNKAIGYASSRMIDFRMQDINDINDDGLGFVILNYTLQFIRPLNRPDVLKTIWSKMRKGGMLFLSEKVISSDSFLNRSYIDLYYDFKRAMGYSDLEISEKREALENVLIPFSASENIAMVKEAGFTGVESFFRWYNFSSFVAVKG